MIINHQFLEQHKLHRICSSWWPGVRWIISLLLVSSRFGIQPGILRGAWHPAIGKPNAIRTRSARAPRGPLPQDTPQAERERIISEFKADPIPGEAQSQALRCAAKKWGCRVWEFGTEHTEKTLGSMWKCAVQKGWSMLELYIYIYIYNSDNSASDFRKNVFLSFTRFVFFILF